MWINKIPLLLLFFMVSCSSEIKPEFSTWYKKNRKSDYTTKKAQVRKISFYSSPLRIDTIYRSMQGPYEVKEIELELDGENLVWLTGYSGKVEKAAQNNQSLPDKFMCHNNLNYSSKDGIPWQVKTKGDNSRIFTLSGGQCKLNFPKGFGIPVPADQEFELVSQVLNHQDKSIDISSRHHISLNYIPDSELNSSLIPLYQQAIFITKQISGPAGEHGLPRLCVDHNLDSSKMQGMQANHNCSVEFETEDFNPYIDSQGRKYTGHWILPYGKEILRTDVTKMLDLKENNRIHAIGVHLHPFAVEFELWDKSADSLLFATELKNNAEGFGFEKISYYSSKDGIAVYKDHRYELKSIYNCTDSTEQHTAMAAMYLYLQDL